MTNLGKNRRLREIDGIGRVIAEWLEGIGLVRLEDLAGHTVESLKELAGNDPSRSYGDDTFADWIRQARDLVTRDARSSPGIGSASSTFVGSNRACQQTAWRFINRRGR